MLCQVRKNIVRSLLRVLAAIGIIVVASSGTPLSIWIYIAWFALAFGCFIRIRTGLAVAFVLFSGVLCILEARWRTTPQVKVPADQPVYVIGDSISAGIGQHEKTWPAVFRDISHLNVKDLSQPGATVESAMLHAQQINIQPATVILEIGGNDLLGGAKAQDFRRQLDVLLGALEGKHQRIIMFELPLLPFKNGFGEAQRSLAGKYHATLIPKKCMVRIFEMKNGTVDDLHLSQEGHNAFAQLVQTVVVAEPVTSHP